MNRINEILNYCAGLAKFGKKNVIFPSQKWSEYLSSPMNEEDEASNSENILHRISDVGKKLSSVPISGPRLFNSKPHFAAWALYRTLCVMSYHFSVKDPQLTEEEDQMVESLRHNGVVPFSDSQKKILNDRCFKKLYGRQDRYCDSLTGEYSHGALESRAEYASGIAYAYPLSQHFCPGILDENLNDMSHAFSESRLNMVIRKYYGSNFCISNVRSWQYYGTDKAQEFGPHKDKFPHGIFKIMTFDGDITPDHGCFEILADRPKRVGPEHKEKVVFQAIGNSPGVLADTCSRWHRAMLPKPGFKRKTIEMTISPFLDPSKNLCLDGGAAATVPWNPFAIGSGAHKRLFDPKIVGE